MTTTHPIPESQQSPADKIWDWAMRAAIPVVMALSLWAINIDRRVTRMESNRFTQHDAREMEDRLRITLENLATVPVWIREDLSEIKGLLRDMDKRIREVETKK